jgi:hypothetical protein
MVAVAVLICSGPSLEQTFGIRGTAYFFLGTVAALWLISSILYERYIPQRLIIPIGIVGWALTLSLLVWYFWFAGQGSVPLI